MEIPDELIDAAIQARFEIGKGLNQIKLEERFFEIGFARMREIYAVSHQILSLALELASKSPTDRSMDIATATQRILEAVPDVSEHTVRRAVEEAFRSKGIL